MVESGFDQFVTVSITFIVAPPGTPLAIRKQISEAVTLALATDELNKPLPRWALTRGRLRRSSLFLTWQTNSFAGLEL